MPIGLSSKSRFDGSSARQQSLSNGGFDKYSKKTRKQQFLEEMDIIVPWRELAAAIEPYYPKPEGAGRHPVGVERMPDETLFYAGSSAHP